MFFPPIRSVQLSYHINPTSSHPFCTNTIYRSTIQPTTRQSRQHMNGKSASDRVNGGRRGEKGAHSQDLEDSEIRKAHMSFFGHRHARQSGRQAGERARGASRMQRFACERLPCRGIISR